MVFLSGLYMSAQQGPQQGHDHQMRDLTPEQMATLGTKKMTLALDLTESQQAKVKSILKEKATDRQAKREAYQNKREAGEKPKLSPEERYTMQNDRLDRQIAYKKEMKNILTAEQYAKWEKMQEGKRKHHDRNEKSAGRRLKKE